MLSLNANGWINQVQHFSSPHYSERDDANNVQLLVIHGISLPPNKFGSNDIIDLFLGKLDTNCHPSFNDLSGLKVSAHFLIRRDGCLLQFVSCHHAAWHAGESFWNGQSQCNPFSIGIELEGSDSCEYDNQQYLQLITLFNLLKTSYPTIRVAGHCHIAPTRKTDPGDYFMWDDFFSTIGKQYDGRPNS